MAAIHVIFDEHSRVSVKNPAQLRGVYTATLDVGDLAFDHPNEIEDVAQNLAKLLLAAIADAA